MLDGHRRVTITGRMCEARILFLISEDCCRLRSLLGMAPEPDKRLPAERSHSRKKRITISAAGTPTNGNATCQRQVIPQDAIEAWVVMHIDQAGDTIACARWPRALTALIHAACAEEDAANTVTVQELPDSP